VFELLDECDGVFKLGLRAEESDGEYDLPVVVLPRVRGKSDGNANGQPVVDPQR